MTEKEALLALNALPDVGSVRIRNLIKYFGSADKALRGSPSKLIEVEGIGKKITQEICSWEKYFDLKKECSLIEKYNAKILILDDPLYPQLLKEIYDPPMILYVKGDLRPEDKQAVAIVGARSASYYGINTARRIAQQLAGHGFTIISGFARGIDTAAHEGALLGKGRTIAVLGCGLDRVYPPENKKLAEKIIENGALVTEFPFGTPPNKQNFPQRNRIISGLSQGVAVIEAGRHSGSLITARLAAEQGREVFSVPGRIDAVTSLGTNVLIKHGAKPMLSLDDILEELQYLSPEKKDIPEINPKPTAEDKKPVPKLDKEQQKIYEVLDEEGLGVDELVNNTGLTVNSIWSNLVNLELLGLVKRLPGSRYVKIVYS